MNSLVECSTDHRRLSSAGSHHLYPKRLVTSPWLVKISKPANVIRFYLMGGYAEFTGVRQEPFQELIRGHQQKSQQRVC